MPASLKNHGPSPLLKTIRREGMTIRQLYEAVSAGFWHMGIVGTPTSIADLMEEWFTTGAGGWLQHPASPVSFVDLGILSIW